MVTHPPRQILTMSTAITHAIFTEVPPGREHEIEDAINEAFIQSFHQERVPGLENITTLEPWFEAMVCAIVLHAAEKLLRDRIKPPGGSPIMEVIIKIFMDNGFSQESGKRAAEKIAKSVYRDRP